MEGGIRGLFGPGRVRRGERARGGAWINIGVGEGLMPLM